MLVYRICKQEEFESIIDDVAFSNLGSRFDFDTSKLNTHKYDATETYLHFFKELDNVIYLGELKDHYLCYYDIPEDLLEQYKGIGFYRELNLFMRNCDLVEYAIPSKLLNREYIVGIDRIKTEIDLDDYIEDPSLHDYVEMVYYQGEDKKLVKV